MKVRGSFVRNFTQQKMADDAVKNFSPPPKKARYGDDAGQPDVISGVDKSEDTDVHRGLQSEKAGADSERNGHDLNNDEEEEERQIMNGEDVSTIN